MRTYQEIIEWLALNLDALEVDEAFNNAAYTPTIELAAYVADVDVEDLVKDLRVYMNVEGIA